MNRYPLAVARAALLALLLLMAQAPSAAQENATSTPVRVRIPTGGAPALQAVASPTPTRTPTPSVVMLEAKPEAGPVNVRSAADIESGRLGTIQAGELYAVLGRRHRWLQIQFLSAPDGRAWVFEELVTVTGDENSIPNLIQVTAQPLSRAGPDSARSRAQLTLTPGAVLTMTASSRILAIPGQGANASAADAASGGGVAAALPTYTFPPHLESATDTPDPLAQMNTPESQDTTPAIPERIPPAVPIALLAAGGLSGLVVYSLRRR